MKIITYLKITSLLLLVCLLSLILKFWTTILMSDANVQKIEFSDFDNVVGAKYKLIPNIVHYVIFDRDQLNFIAYLSILSVLKNQKPKKIFIHTNKDQLSGYYWEKINKKHIVIKYLEKPTHVYGTRLSSVYHSSDVARIHVLQTMGGIYLDTDMIVLRSLDRYLHFEITIAWPEKEYLGNQIIISHKNARFLKLWLESYQHYRPTRWYYNAGELPTDDILKVNPSLIHREKTYFGVQNLIDKLYSTDAWPEWKDFYAIHLLSRHDGAPIFLNESIVADMRTPFGEIARLIFNHKK